MANSSVVFMENVFVYPQYVIKAMNKSREKMFWT
jgi:hypothetical protein